MLTYFDSQNNSHILTEQIGIGGEGTVFVCPDDANLVAKIYHEPIDDQKAEKLVWMAANKNEQLLKVAAWIVDVLRDAPDGKIVGFLMPNVKAKEIHELYSLKSRRIYFPHATWKFLLHTAANLARAFYNLHKHQHIMGDINHGNCVVLADGTVKLIDCDSYSISRGDFRYPCEVGVATHLAPELQRVNLRGIEREEKHDNFGLAVILFQLLFLGRHPFAGNFLGSEDKSLEDCIRESRFAYGTGAKDRWVKQPPGTLSLSAVSPRLSLMFERAFLTEDRPAPHEWIEALEDLSANLKQCDVQPGHYFFDALRDCPWCEIEAKTGLTLFPFTGEKQIGEGEKFNIFTVENLIQSFNIPNSAVLALPKSNVLGLSLSPTIEIEKNLHTGRIVKFAVAQFAMIMVMTGFFGIGFAFMWGVITLIFSLVYLSGTYHSIKDGAEYDLESAQREWNKLEAEWKASDTKSYLETDLALVKKKIADYENLQRESRVKMVHLRDEYFQNNLTLYLKSFKISESKIPDLKNENAAFLKNFNIRTAADVEIKKLSALPANQSVIQKLLDWRANLEREFDYQPDHELPEVERQRFTARLNEKRGRIEREIEKLVVAVRSGATMVNQKRRQLNTEAGKIAVRINQAKYDLESIGSNALALVVLCMTTLLTLAMSNAIFSVRINSTENAGNNNYVRDIAANSRVMTNFPSPTPPKVQSAIPESLTDKEIAAMSEPERFDLANSIFLSLQSYPVTVGNQTKYYSPDDEKKMRLAYRLSPHDTKILNKLGNIYYEQEKYAQAIDLFEKSSAIDPGNYDTKNFLGDAYLKNKQYKEALDVFDDNLTSYKWCFNAGLAYKGLKQYDSALKQFEAAKKFSIGEDEVQKEIDFCNRKLGNPPDISADEEDSGAGSASGYGSGIGNGSGTGNGGY